LSRQRRNLAASKKVLRVAKKKAKAAKGGKLERKQANRVLKSIKDVVDLVRERCDNLQKQAEESESSAGAEH
jgi:hypothetical protein